MKIDLEKGLPVWVWGILFLVVVLPFSFRPTSNQNLTSQSAVPSTLDAQATTVPFPTATFDPAVTDSNIIEIAPAPRPAEE